jgi:DMSO/TMAO reductase YedYZ molybdopterin-dependent catalytic subunit
MTDSPQVSADPGQVLARLDKDSRLIPRDRTNFESRPDLFSGLLTPNELFFIRSNGPVSVEIDADTWRLSVAGQVERELSLSLADLRAMPARTITAFLECSGNSRSRFPADPAPVEGTNWGNGAVGNATWTGTSLANVLEQAGIREGAVDVVCQGGDFERMQRSLPIDVARNPDVLLAWEMNSQPLPAPHGGPVRLLVPGWGAIASTKWLIGLDVIDHRFEGYYQTEQYVLYDASGAPTGPVTRMPVKSLITVPQGTVAVTRGRQTINGYAWSGYGRIATVEVSTDGGRTWGRSDIVEEAGPYSWVRFEHEWDAEPGPALLQSRATDAEGNSQPEHAAWNVKGYQMNAIYEVPVTVQ